jgi:uncharacterized SAM-binding protein YcdF (DUF218 family)
LNRLCAVIGHRRSRWRARQVTGCAHSHCVVCNAGLVLEGLGDWVVRQRSSVVSDHLPTRRLTSHSGARSERSLRTGPSSANRVLAAKVRRVASYSAVSAGGAGLLLLLGLGGFFHDARASTRPLSSRADAIVAFSGDPNRIRAAGHLLAGGYAQRLLIVGQDNGDEAQVLRTKYPELSDCCIVRNALSRTTREDARLAGSWLKKTRARSVILVTSDFHIPRATVELAGQAPRMTIVPSGVSSGNVSVSRMIQDPAGGTRVLQREFPKYVVASIPGLENFLGTGVAQEAGRQASVILYRRLGGGAAVRTLRSVLSVR